MSSDLSFQQLDPIGGHSTRPVTIVMCVGIAVYALCSALIEGGITIPALAVLSIVLFALSAAGVIFWSHPLRAPFSRTAFLAIMAAATLALAVGSLSSWGNLPNVALGPIAVALIILQLSPYRPARDLIAATVFTTIVDAFFAVIRPGVALGNKPIVVTVVEAIIPLLAIGLASGAYASAQAHKLGSAAEEREDDLDAESIVILRKGIARSVQHDRVSILNQSVVPFLTELLQRDNVTETDRTRSRVIAASIRSLMVADVERSWLDAVIEHLAEGSMASSATQTAGSEVVQDDDRVANAMSSKQRSVVRAVLAAIFAHPGFDADGLGILIERDDDSCLFALTAKLDGEESMLRSGLGAYFAALRGMFTDLEISFDPPTLTLRFSYDHL